MESRTFTGKTVDEATGIALKSLGAKLEDVDIKVVSPGRSGIMGLGGAPAVIEVRVLRRQDAPPQREAPPAPPRPARQPVTEAPRPPAIAARTPSDEGPETTEAPAAPGERRFDRRRRRGGTRYRGREEGAPAERAEPAAEADQEQAPETGEAAERRAPAAPRVRRETSEEEMAAEQDYPEAPPAERDAEAEQMVAKLLDYFLASMGVVAETFVRDELDNGSLVFEIEGADAGLLIGRRGETLQALQFVVRMITNRQLGRKAYIIIDVESYRERRAEMLRNLARRTAGRVATSSRPASLEPMSPAERRIIHMALADHPRVRTESEGEGNRRRVVILPKRGGRGGRGDSAPDRGGRGDMAPESGDRGPARGRAEGGDRGPERRSEGGDPGRGQGGWRRRRQWGALP